MKGVTSLVWDVRLVGLFWYVQKEITVMESDLT